MPFCQIRGHLHHLAYCIYFMDDITETLNKNSFEKLMDFVLLAASSYVAFTWMDGFTMSQGAWRTQQPHMFPQLVSYSITPASPLLSFVADSRNHLCKADSGNLEQVLTTLLKGDPAMLPFSLASECFSFSSCVADFPFFFYQWYFNNPLPGPAHQCLYTSTAPSGSYLLYLKCLPFALQC